MTGRKKGSIRSKRQRLSLPSTQPVEGNSASIPSDADAGESDPGPLLENNYNPLLNDLVLDIFFKHVEPKDLLECRQVCKQWNAASKELTRSKIEITIYGPKKKNKKRNIHNFVKLMDSNTLGFPFAKFRLGSFYVMDAVGQRFIQLFGTLATRYDLAATGEDHTVANVAALLRSSPKLESFVMPCRLISHLGFTASRLFPRNPILKPKPTFTLLKTFSLAGKEKPDERRKNCPTFFKEFFKVAHNVSTFDLRDSIEYYEDDELINPRQRRLTDGSLDVLKALEKLKREGTIENMSFSQVTRAHFESLSRMITKGLKLKELELHFKLGLRDSSRFNVVELFKDTLVSLRTTHNYKLDLSNFPNIPQLKLLDLKIPFSTNTRLNWNEFNIIFPALETLGLHCDIHRRMYNFYEILEQYNGADADVDCFPNLELRTLSLRGIRMIGQTFDRILNVFPSITALELDINLEGGQILQKIWTDMPGLEKLSISGTLRMRSDMDSVLTGIPVDQIKEIESGSQLRELEEMTPEIRKDAITKLVQEYRTLPSIANLENLRYLRLSMTEHWGRTYNSNCHQLSDASGYLGLYSLKHVKHLFVQNCGLSKICSEILVKKLGLDSWIIRRRTLDNIIPPKGVDLFPTTIIFRKSQD